MESSMVRLVLVLLLVSVIAAVKFLPWWSVLAGALVLALLVKFLGGRLLRWVLVSPFRAKSAVLKDAEVLVHAVTPAPRFESKMSADDDNDGESRADTIPDAQFAAIEFTITPRTPEGPFAAWEAGSLELVRSDAAPVDPYSDDAATPSEDAVVHSIEWLDGEAFADASDMKFVGPARLRLRVALRPGIRAFKLRYYFEDLGVIPRPVDAPLLRNVSATNAA